MTLFSVINRLRLLGVQPIYLPTEKCVQSLLDEKTDSEMEEWCVSYAKISAWGIGLKIRRERLGCED